MERVRQMARHSVLKRTRPTDIFSHRRNNDQQVGRTAADGMGECGHTSRGKLCARWSTLGPFIAHVARCSSVKFRGKGADLQDLFSRFA